MKIWLGPVIVLCLIRMAAADVVGEARVIDGDTIEVAGERVRLKGIDAPERAQDCRAGTETWACGRTATLALADAARGQQVRCAGNRRDRYGRLIAVCYAGDTDLNARMVREGWALAFRRYDLAYVPEETEARAAARGMWRGQFIAPWDWRRGERYARAD